MWNDELDERWHLPRSRADASHIQSPPNGNQTEDAESPHRKVVTLVEAVH